MHEQSLETIGTLESKLRELGLSFTPIKAGHEGLAYKIEVLRLRIIISPRDIYDPDGVPLIDRLKEGIERYLSPAIDPEIDPKVNQDLKFKEALFWGAEFDQLMLTQRDAAYTISEKFGVGVFPTLSSQYYDEFACLGRITHNHEEWIPAIRAVTGAYSALEAYKNIKK